MNERISIDEALELFNTDWPTLKKMAHEKRVQTLPANQATYLVMRIISLTNICVADCSYCAFYRSPGAKDGYVIKKEQIFQKIDELIAQGGNLVAMEGGFNPDLRIGFYEETFSSIKERYGDKIEIYGLTSVEIKYVAKRSRITVEEALDRLYKAGLRWIPGGGAEILTDEWRKKLSPRKYSVADYFNVLEQGRQRGYGITSTMVIGFGEDYAARVEHLQHVRDFQDRIGGFSSFLAWTYQSSNTALGGEITSSQDYLRTIAVSRLFLDNIPHIRTSVLTQGMKGADALQCGADDFDIALEDQVTQEAGVVIEPNISKITNRVKALGITPTMRQPWSVS